MLEKKQQFANQAALLVVCCCHAVIESQVEGYFCSIIYLSEDKRGREREAVCTDMHMCTRVRGRLLRIWQWSQ